MKICYVCADLGIELDGTKGASAHVRGLIRALRDAGHDVLVVSPSAGAQEATGAGAVMTQPSVLPEGLQLGAQGKRLTRALRHLLHNASVETTLESVIPQFKPHFIYERYSPFGVAGGIAADRHGIPHLLEVNAPLAWEGKHFRNQALSDTAETLEKAAFAATSQIIAVSAELRQRLISDGAPPSRITVIPNGVETRLFSVDGPHITDGLQDKTVIGFVGGLRPWHGIEDLAKAFRVLAQDPQYHLLIVGDGPEARVIEALSDDHPGRVTFVRSIRHDLVASYLRAIDIAVAPYPESDWFYFSPLKILEYMSTGRAIIASEIGQVPHFITHESNGLLVPPGDAAALARAAERFRVDAELRVKCETQAAADARAKHDWSRRAADVVTLAEPLVGSAKNPSRQEATPERVTKSGAIRSRHRKP